MSHLNTMTPPALWFASAPYANQLPLAHFIPDVASHARLLIVEHPSAVPAKLESGATDAALLPVVELARRPDTVMIDELGVCAAHVEHSLVFPKEETQDYA